MTDWTALSVSRDRTHHVAEDRPVYAERFDEVLGFHPPGLAAVRKGCEAWHIEPSGAPAYAARFVRTFGFYDGLAAVASADGWHHVHPHGAAAYGMRFAWCGNYQEARCSIRGPDGSYVHIDRTGKPLYSARWRYAGDFRDGIAVVQGDDGRSTHVDCRGEFVHPYWFFDLDVFHKGFARARDERGWLHVDASGLPAYDRRFAAVEPFYNGFARIERVGGALELVDEKGATVVELRGACGPFGPCTDDIPQSIEAAGRLRKPKA